MRSEVTAVYTPATVKTVTRRFVIRWFGVEYFIAVAVVAAGFAYLAVNRVNEWTTGAAGAALALGTIFPIVFWKVIERNGLSRLRRMASPTVKMLFDDRGIMADSELGAATVGWKSIEKIWEFPEAWLLFVGKQQYVMVPLPALTEELKLAIKTEVKKNNAGMSRSTSPGDVSAGVTPTK